MFLQPKKFKYKSVKKGVLSKFEYKSNKLSFGDIGLKASESGLISSKQIESARRAIARKIKRKGKIWIRIFPDYPVTSKPTESRMGKGKGNLSYWSAKVKGGTTIFEICGVPEGIAKEALKSGSHKLPVKTVIFD